jgi:hypothetical protein
MSAQAIRGIPGVSETVLAEADAGRIPDASAPAPWATVLDAVVWWHRAAPGAVEHLPPALRGRPALPITIGALIRYRETPVGPYHEVLGSPVLLAGLPLPSASVPFIAVDSAASVHGGRTNWALPKTLARFAWPESMARGFELDAAGGGWSVHARVAPRRRRLPLATPLATRQIRADGTELGFISRCRGRARVAGVEVGSHGPTLPAWLRSGRHAGLVIEDARVVVGEAREV